MPPKCPVLLDQIIFSDDAQLAARLSCFLARPGFYLPVIDDPRMQRPDREAEVIHRTNVAARARAKQVYLAGLGYRWTYEFTDSEGPPRKLVVDIALGIGATEDDELSGFCVYWVIPESVTLTLSF
jgi:hypothetical protein